MFACKDCKNYIPINELSGACGGNIVFPESPSKNCPKKSFQRKIENWLIAPYEELFSELKKTFASTWKKR